MVWAKTEQLLLEVFLKCILTVAFFLRKLKQGLCINLVGWDGQGDVREFQKGGDWHLAGRHFWV